MAAEIYKYDNMLSVRERPWHGLGVILEDYPTIEEAEEHSGLSWKAEIRPAYFESEKGAFVKIPGAKAVVRNDINMVIGSVGDRYEVYQNSEMWAFIETFQKQMDCKIETAGSLKNGATTWVLAKNGCTEYINGDPIEEFFLFRNSFNGTSPIMCMFTNIRVVCNNTMSMAVRGARNIFKVRHTQSANGQLTEVQKALGIRANYRSKIDEVMAHLAKTQMDMSKIVPFLSNVVFPEPQQIVQKGGMVVDLEEASKKAITSRKNKINAVVELVEGGAGADIPGVRGTAYGLLQALTEWADHEKSIKVTQNRDRQEVKFENAFWGTGADFKQVVFDELLKAA